MRGFEDYDLERELGCGATARVYRARHRGTGEIVSLKVFHPGHSKETTFRQRIQRELNVCEGLSHPGIVGLRGFVEGESLALELDFVDGENLEKFQSRLPYIAPEISVMIVIEMLAALEYAHSRGVVHRDLKPENVLISSDGKIFVTDFGLAKFAQATLITQTNTLVGSIDYSAPEQIKGDTFTASSDIFSVAAILYFLTTGTRPFGRPTVAATLVAICQDGAEPAQKRNPKISAALTRILEKGLEKTPEARFQSAEAFRLALSSYLDGIGLTSSQRDLGTWMENPSAFTLQLLENSATHLVTRAESALASRQWDGFLEDLSHLMLKAPENAAIARLLQRFQKEKRRRKGAWIIFSAAATVGIVLLVGFGLRYRPRAIAAVEAVTASPRSMAAATVVAPPLVKPVPTGTVIFEVDDDVTVYWDGKRVKNPNVELKKQRVGSHVLLLERPGHETIRAKVDVKSAKPTVVKAR